MEALSALAIVAQRTIPPAGQEAVQKAILKAESERTLLDYERSRMVAEDRCQKEVLGAIRRFRVTCTLYREQIEEKNEELEQKDAEILEITSNIYDLEDTVERLTEQIGQTPFEQRCFLEHTHPTDTEMNDRRKFLIRWFS